MSKHKPDVIDHGIPYIALGIVAVFACLCLTWAVQGNEFFLARFFAPRMEQTRRETFEQSKAYREGQAQELRRMQGEYVRASAEQKTALRSVIIHQFADLDETALPSDLRDFLRSMRSTPETEVH